MQNGASPRRSFLHQSGSALAGAALAGALPGAGLRRREQHHQDRPGRLRRARHRRRLERLEHPRPHQALGHGRRLPGPRSGKPQVPVQVSLDPLREGRYDQVDAPGARASRPAGGQDKQIDVPPEWQFSSAWTPTRRPSTRWIGPTWCCWPPRRRSAPSTWNTPWKRASTSSWRSCSPSTRRAFAACSRRVKRPRKRTSRSPAGSMPALQGAGRGRAKRSTTGRSAR